MSYLAIALTSLLTGIAIGAYLGYLVASLKKDNEQLKARNAELETNGEYPKRRTHADGRRIEDLMADADAIWDDLTLLQLHHKQAARLEGERLEDFNTRLSRLKARLSDARKASPMEYEHQDYK